MGQALYRKYRSRSLNEIIGQEHITKTLSRALKDGRISHAYLFTGPRGVGKTSVARIIAHEVNKLPYTDESIHLDIIEIDAASNRRIDEIRDLRERVNITPTSAKYKVYIIDEVHMLTREAFNALLKTLEEPPAHCIFILATTEAHKLPETIISRTQRFTFKPLQYADAIEYLKTIAKKEHIKIDEEALGLLAEHGDGSFRDSIGLLDQLSNLGKPITAEIVRSTMGIPPQSSINKLLLCISEGDSQECMQVLAQLREQGISAAAVANSLSAQLRARITSSLADRWALGLLKQLLEVSMSARPQDYLEVCILEASASIPKVAHEDLPPDKPDRNISHDKETIDKEAIKESPPKAKPNSSSQHSFELNDWPKIVDTVKTEAASIYTALRLAEPRTEDNLLILAFQFPLHQKKMSIAKSKDLLGRIIEEITGATPRIECIVDKSITSTVIKKVSATTEGLPIAGSMSTISNIFGGAEVLES
jgi:DNA polymerase-3 subunit gamma/tau